jgi:hypothetical protein
VDTSVSIATLPMDDWPEVAGGLTDIGRLS